LNNGLKQDEWEIDEDISRRIIRNYTRESGVRNLEREIAKIGRKLVKKIDANEKTNKPIKEKDLEELLGIPKFNYGEIEEENRIGVVTGLAWTEVGGEILKIESVIMPGKGKMQITGKLGEVMQESIKASKSYIRSRSLDYGIIPPIFDKKDFHVHVPDGATPKDGPSAGIAMVTSIISAITEIPVHKNVAMTGEMTLRGLVLPIGGLKEKLLAAHRAGIKKVLIPLENKKDLVEVPEAIKKSMEIIPVKNVDEVLKVALTKPLKRVEWVDVDQLSGKNKTKEELSTH
jgi:ATP-dependent Lon protease